MTQNVNHGIQGTFGTSVAISNGNALVGSTLEIAASENGTTASNAGRVYAYQKGNQWEYLQEVSRSLVIQGARFGSELDLDGGRAIVAAPDTKISTAEEIGRVWFFELNEQNEWEETQEAYPFDWASTSGKRFGSSVAMNGNWVAVGYEEDDSFEQGSVAIYEFSDGNNQWNLKSIMVAEDAVNFNKLGASVAISGSYVFSGALQGDSPTQLKSGAAYVFYTEEICLPADVSTLEATETIVCSGASTTLSIANGNLNDATEWQWYSGSCGGTPVGIGSSIEVSPIQTTVYYVRGETGCTDGACAQIEIQVDNGPEISFQSSHESICEGETMILTVSGAKNYVFSPKGVEGLIGKSFVPEVGEQQFTAIGVSANGCQGSIETLNVDVYAVPVFNVSNNGGTLAVKQSGLNYQWVSCERDYRYPIKNETGQTYQPTKNGFYGVIVENNNGCKDTTETCLLVTVTDINALSESEEIINVYPNPTDGIIHLEKSVSWTLSNLQGELLDTNNEATLDLSIYAEGVYLLKFENGQVTKIVKR